MKKLLIFFFAIIPLISLSQPEGFDRNKLDSFLSYMTANDKFMGTVALSHKGEVFYNKSFGIINEKNEAPQEKTTYRIGSISKMFTAVMILQLIEEGELSFNTKLSDFFPKVPNAEAITIKNMLNHSSGLHNFTNDPDYLKYHTDEKSRKEMLKMIRKNPSAFEPGEKAEYSNTNYVLLGYILEEATGASYAVELENRIIEKVGLKNTYFGNPKEQEAYSFSFKDGWEREARTNMDIPHGAGGIVSTAEDLVKFIEGLFHGKLLTEESLKKMTKVENKFGLGIFPVPFYQKTGYGHNGGIDGFQSMLLYFPEDSLAYSFIANGLNYPANNVTLGILSITYGKMFNFPEFKPTISVSEERLRKFTGTYSSSQIPLEITIMVEDGQLRGQATGQPSFPLEPTDSVTFKFDPAGLQIKFSEPEGDHYKSLMLFQGGGQFLFNRKN